MNLNNKHINQFKKDGYFCDAADGTKDFIDYWDDQKLKCRKGVFRN